MRDRTSRKRRGKYLTYAERLIRLDLPSAPEPCPRCRPRGCPDHSCDYAATMSELTEREFARRLREVKLT